MAPITESLIGASKLPIFQRVSLAVGTCGGHPSSRGKLGLELNGAPSFRKRLRIALQNLQRECRQLFRLGLVRT